MTAAAGGGAAGTAGTVSASPASGATTITTVVTGPTPGAREAAIHAAIVAAPPVPTAIILEGLADAQSPLADCGPHVTVVRIAPGCLCCAGNLVLRVSLNRLLRRAPAQLLISLANAEHAGQLRGMLESAPYVGLLTLGANWHIHLT